MTCNGRSVLSYSCCWVGVSLAGFAGLIAAFRVRADWDPVNLWRVKTIVGDAFVTAFAALASNPGLFDYR